MVRAWFAQRYPAGPTPAQAAAWPVIAARRHALVVAPTGTGKTLAAFLAVLDELVREQLAGSLEPGVRCVYVSPLRSLGYDVARNLCEPLDGIARLAGWDEPPIRVGVRTGDTTPTERRRQRERPPHLLITTPESLALLLSQAAWRPILRSVERAVVDEVHALAPNKRGADLAVSFERLAAWTARDPARIGLSATCRPAEAVARFLVGPERECGILEPPPPPGRPGPAIAVESLIRPDEAPHRGLTYRRLLRRLRAATARERTTVVFANTRAFAEKLTHDLRAVEGLDEASVAAHHSALDAARRRTVEAALQAGTLRAVVTSTSLELGVDIAAADLSVLVGLSGSVARCLQRVGRSGHAVDRWTRGVLLAATPGEVAAGAVLAAAARRGAIEETRAIQAPLDVLCQHLVGLACTGEQEADAVFALVRQSGPFARLERADFDACLDYLAGDLAAPAGAYEPEPGATPRWTAPRLWRARGLFGLRSGRVARWLRRNIGTITSEETVKVVSDGQVIGSVEGAYAERLVRGDRFVLDGRALEFRKLDGLTLQARSTGGEPLLPRWTSDRLGLTADLAGLLAHFRVEASRVLRDQGPDGLQDWLLAGGWLDEPAAEVVVALFAAQEQASEVPEPGVLLVEDWPETDGWAHAFHAALGRRACEALGRALAARAGRELGGNVTLVVGDLGWKLVVPAAGPLDDALLARLLDPDGFEADVLAGLDRGELLASRFKHVAATGLMVLRNPEWGRTRVGGLNWVVQRLFPLVRAACPTHPLVREARRELLEDVLDAAWARAWLVSRPLPRKRSLEGPSPFAAAWIDLGAGESLAFETPADALRRLHARIHGEAGHA